MGRSRTNLSAEKSKVNKPRKVYANPATVPIDVPRFAPYIRKFVLGMTTILGLGYILPNIATIAVLAHILSTFAIESQEIVFQISGTILFLIASVLLIALGVLIMTWGIRYYTNASYSDIVFGGAMLASFYLFCLGVGSVLLSPQINFIDLLLVVSPVLIIVSTAAYMIPSFPYKLGGSLLAIISGALLAMAITNAPPLSRVLDWNVPFSGPFMSLALSEGMVVILGSITALVNSLPYERKTKPLTHVLFSTMGLVYGISLFIGAFLLSFSFLDIIWKAPYPYMNGGEISPLYGQPSLVFGAVVFWSANLVMLEIGGFVLILVSGLGLAYTAKEFSQLSQT